MGKFTAALGTGKAGVAATDKLNGVLGDQGLAAWKPLFASAHLDAGAYFTVYYYGCPLQLLFMQNSCLLTSQLRCQNQFHLQ